MPIDLPSKEQVFSWMWSNKEWIAAKLKELHEWYRGSGKLHGEKAGILILGAGGVGKTTLARLLSGDFDLLFDAFGGYDESLGVERFTLKDAPNVEIVVPPGQRHRRETAWRDLYAELGAGKYRGIILVSAYGYHSLGEPSYRNHRLYKGDKNAFLKLLLKQQRSDEVGILRQLQPHVSANAKKLWFVSLVTKQDLWWPNRSAVEAYYREGDYGREIRRMVKQKATNLRHEFIFASMIIGNLDTLKNERLKANAEGYDYRLQMHSLRRFFEMIDALKDWESKK